MEQDATHHKSIGRPMWIRPHSSKTPLRRARRWTGGEQSWRLPDGVALLRPLAEHGQGRSDPNALRGDRGGPMSRPGGLSVSSAFPGFPGDNRCDKRGYSWHAGVAKLVTAADLKSAASMAYGFDPRRPHHLAEGTGTPRAWPNLVRSHRPHQVGAPSPACGPDRDGEPDFRCRVSRLQKGPE
jgi:hypothetical protein